jgi:hypothetical protein
LLISFHYSFSSLRQPSFLFIFDVSLDALRSGFAQSAAASVLASLGRLDDDTFVSLVLVANNLVLVDLKKNNQIVFSEFDELPFMVAPVTLRESRNALYSALNRLMKMKATVELKGHCLGSGLEMVVMLLKDIGGIILAFVLGGATVGPRRVSPRSREELVKESNLLRMSQSESSQFYRNIAHRFSQLLISLHLFITADQFVDLAVLGVPCCLTGGKCFHYSTVSRSLHTDISRVLSAKYFWNASLRV